MMPALQLRMPSTETQGRTTWRVRYWLTWPVWNHDDRRLRAPIRALLPLVLTFLALAVIQTTVRGRFEHPIRELLELSGLIVVLAGGLLVAARLLDRRPVVDYGLSFDRDWWKAVAVGCVTGLAVNAGALVVSLQAGWVSVTGVAEAPGVLSFVPAVIVTFAYIAVAALWEEFIFRATMLKNLAEGGAGYVGRKPAVLLAVLLSTLVFATLHGGKVTHISQYGYYVIAGLVLGSVYVLSGDLALPIGFHVFYNFSQGLLGLGVSQVTPELVVLEIAGPDKWIGEEGLVHVIFAFLGGLLLLAYIRWRDGQLQIDDRVTQWNPLTEQ
ncbi:Metal-dependent membrane protease, CAAX family (plasmid) [Haloferax volcanii]|nr:Metal-dependent membrane protease, CAAX family [Haloferax lucentense]